MPQDLLRDRVKCVVPNPGPVAVGSTITLGAAQTGYRSFLTAFGGGVPAYFILADGAGRAITGVWTINATIPETATITEILGNDRLGNTAGETFAGACTAWCSVPMAEFPVVRSGPLAGFRNLVINGNPVINQRNYGTGAATTVANQYTLDRWRVVTSGQSLAYANASGIITMTCPAGGIEQVIEGASILPGIYTLSWVGSATALINGAVVANGGSAILPGGTNATLRLSGGTAALIQLEPGPLKTPFEMRPIGVELALCQRYACRVAVDLQSPTLGLFGVPFFFPVTMRAVPTLSANLVPGAPVNISLVSENATSVSGGFFQISAGTGGGSYGSRTNLYTAEL